MNPLADWFSANLNLNTTGGYVHRKQAAAADLACQAMLDPYALVDAMVKVGVLKRAPSVVGDPCYQIQVAHVHEWYVAQLLMGDRALLCCTAAGCREGRVVPNQLPIELPK